MADTSRYKLALPDSEDFFINDNSTPEEQSAVFNNPNNGTGIVQHSYTGAEQDISQAYVADNSDIILPYSSDLIAGGMGMPENPLLNMPSADGLWRNIPVWNYSPMEIINSLAIYQCSRVRMLDILNDIVDSDEYDYFMIGVPANSVDSAIQWKDTYRTQVSIPPESYLLMLMAYDITPGAGREAPPPTGNPFRIQVFDDGAGEYLFDLPFNSLLVAGSGKDIGNSNHSFGPFILPSPLAIVKPGLLTITFSNVNTTNNTLDNNISAYIALGFAMPKKYREMMIGEMKGWGGGRSSAIRGLIE